MNEVILQRLQTIYAAWLYNVYRWKLEEDIAILRSVLLMDRYFAKQSLRFFPHMDRGGLRKRYKVLEQRVKGSMKREKKSITGKIKKRRCFTLMPKLAKARGRSVDESLLLPKQKKMPSTKLEHRGRSRVQPPNFPSAEPVDASAK